MNKVTFFRKSVMEQHENNKLVEAALSGEALIREHKENQSCHGMAYADDLFNLACIYDEMGMADRAISLYVISARLAYSETGTSLPFTLRLNNLGALLSRTGRDEAAYNLLAHMADILRDNLTASALDLSDGLYNLANAAAGTGRVPEALELHKEALEIRENAGLNSDVINSLHSLAVIYEEQNKREQALSCAQSALNRSVGTDAYPSACCYLADLYGADGQSQKAVPLYANALREVAQTGGRQHSAYFMAASKLAAALAEARDYRRALSLWKSICSSLERSGTADNSLLFHANCLRNMALMHKNLKELDEAGTLMLRAMKIKIRVMGSQTNDIVNDAFFMIEVCLRNNKLDEALEMLVFALMRSDAEGSEKLMKSIESLYDLIGQEQIQTMLAEIERLNNHPRLWNIVRKWTDWMRG